MHEAMI